MVMAGTGVYAPEEVNVVDFLLEELEEVSQTSCMPIRLGGMRLLDIE